MSRQILCVVLLVFLGLSGCASNKEYAKIVPDRSVQRDYTNSVIPEGYVYYYAGPEGRPDAIVGIREGYEMRSTYWHQINLTEERMTSLNSNIRDEWFYMGGRSREIGASSNGYRIITKDGREVGLLFSKYRRVVATFPEPGVITLSVPHRSLPSYRYDD